MKNPDVYLYHILECITAIKDDYLGGTETPEKLFFEDDKTRQATLHRLQTLGESVKRVPDELCADIDPGIDWQAIGDSRNIIVHEYLGIDLTIVWKVVQSDLPKLREAITKHMEKNHE